MPKPDPQRVPLLMPKPDPGARPHGHQRQLPGEEDLISVQSLQNAKVALPVTVHKGEDR